KTLSPGDRADPGLASVRGLEWLGPNRRRADTQLVLLSAAAQREERCLVASPTLKGGAAQKVASKPISAGFCKRGQGEKRRSDLATGRGVRRVLRAQAHRRGRQSDRGR